MNIKEKIETLRNLQADAMIEVEEMDTIEEIIKDLKMFDGIKKIINKETDYEEHYFNHTSAMVDDIKDVLKK